jgi:hypothetical protein
MKRQANNDLHISQTPSLSKQVDDIELVMDKRRDGVAEMITPERSNTFRQGGLPKKTQSVMKSFNESLLVQGLSNNQNNTYHEEMRRLPFTVSILDAETHLCALC